MRRWTEEQLAAAISDYELCNNAAHAARLHGMPPTTLRSAIEAKTRRVRQPAAHSAQRTASSKQQAASSKQLAAGSSHPTTVLVCPDAHHPYVDKLAWSTFLAVARTLHPSHIVIIGDFVDCYSISDYPKSPGRVTSLREEVTAASVALCDLAESSEFASLIYCLGNHEDRFDRLIAKQAPALADMIDLRAELDPNGCVGTWVPYGSWIKLGKVAFTHDLGFCGVNAARSTLTSFGGNVVFGHSHRAALVYDGTVDGERHVAMNVGWLGDLSAIDYGSKASQRRSWQHGFGVVDFDNAGNGWATFVPIINGCCIVHGRAVRAAD